MISYPKLNRNATNRVTIPLLDGGINLSDGCTRIGDNQLINAKNVWFDGQTLKTRPKATHKVKREFSKTPANDDIVGDFTTFISLNKLGIVYTHISVCYNFSDGELNLYALINTLNFTENYYEIPTSAISSTDIDHVKVNCYKGNAVTTNGTGIFVLVGLYGADGEKGALIYELSNTATTIEFETIYSNIGEFFGAETKKQGTTVDKLYKPLVYQNGKGNKYSELPTTDTTEYAPASVYEGKNLLPSAMRFKFMSDGKSTRYNLPATIDITNIATVKLNIAGFEWTTDGNKTVLVFEKGAGQMGGFGSCAVKIGGAEKTITVSMNSTGFEFCDISKNSNVNFVLPMTQTSDNIELIAYNINYDDYEKILDMPIHTEYGGGEGIFGGSRVFLGGYKNFICFSTASSSTYFSENNYIGVGDSSSVTAFGKMNELLVIFKPNSIYATQTTYSDSITAENIQNGSIGDVATTYCYFPIYQLTDEVGCDIPNSIRLCLNRLIFANTSNNVYCLVTQSSNSQRNVYCLSEQINAKLDLKTNAFSASFSDYYLLFCENRVYVLNYNKDSYRYIYSYTNRTNNTSTRYLTWWYWELEQNNGVDYYTAISYQNKVYLVNKSVNQNNGKTLDVNYYLLDDKTSDDKCDVLIETKVFDFSAPERYKKIEKLYLGIGNDEYAEIDLTINTDKGEVYHRPLLISNDDKMSTADNGEVIRLIPYCNKLKQFSIKLEANGVMSLDSLSIYYKQLGEVMS